MFWKKTAEKTKTLAFHLTLIYAVTFTASSAAFFFFTHALIDRFSLRQVDLRLTTYWDQLTNEIEMDLVPSLDRELKERATARGTEKVFYQILDRNGRIVASSDLSGWSSVRVDRLRLVEAGRGKPLFETVRVHDLRRVLRVMYAPILGDKVFMAGVSLAEFEALLNRLAEVFAIMVIAAGILGVSLGWQMSRKAMSGVEEVTRAASVIAGGRFDQRVNVSGQGREITDLCVTFNGMQDTIRRLISQLKETSDAIAHDLRTPVTRIKGAAETTLLSDAGLSEYKQLAENICEETELLLGIINTNLEISEAEAGLAKVKTSPFDLGKLAAEAVNLFSPLCEEKGISLSYNGPQSLAFESDVLKIQRILGNLLDNASKFTPRGGAITVTLAVSAENTALSVSDTGPGIPEKDIPNVFTRFFRLDESRNTVGNGLGLALALSTARLLGGDILLESSPQKGSTFTLMLPPPTTSPDRHNITKQ